MSKRSTFSLGARSSDRKSTADGNAAKPSGNDAESLMKIDEDLRMIEKTGFWTPEIRSDPKTIPIPKLHEFHKPTSPWIELPRPSDKERKSVVQSFPNETFQLVLNIEQCMFVAGQDNFVELYVSLYDADQKKWITEEYCVCLTPHGFPVNGQLDSTQCLFKNLKREEIEGNVYIVVKIIRFGDMALSESTATTSTSASKNRNRPRYRRPFAMGVISLKEQREYMLKAYGMEKAPKTTVLILAQFFALEEKPIFLSCMITLLKIESVITLRLPVVLELHSNSLYFREPLIQ